MCVQDNEHIHHPPQVSLCLPPLKSPAPAPRPQSLGNQICFLSLQSHLHSLQLYKWKHTVCTLFACLLSLSIIILSSICVVVCIDSSLLFISDGILLYEYPMVCLFIRQLMDTCEVSSFFFFFFLLFQSMLLRAFGWKSWPGCVLSLFLGKLLREEWLDHILGSCLTVWKDATLPSKSVVPFYITQQCMRIPIDSRSWQCLVCSGCLTLAIPRDATRISW